MTLLNLQILKSLIEGISQRDRKTYKLGRIMSVNTPVIGGRKADLILPDDVDVHKTSENIRDYLDSTSYKEQVIIDKLPIIRINEPLFCIAIDNLIRNGLKYNDSDVSEDEKENMRTQLDNVITEIDKILNTLND